MNRQELKNIIVEKMATSRTKKPLIDITINELLADIKLFAEEIGDAAIIEFVDKLKEKYTH